MSTELSDFLKARQMPSGRTTHAARTIEAEARQRDLNAIADLAKQTLDFAAFLRDLEMRRKGGQIRAQYGPLAPHLDAQIDRGLAAMVTNAQTQLEIAGPEADNPTAKAARRIDAELLPRGIAAVTQISFPEQHESVNLLLKRLRPGGDLAHEAKLLTLAPFVDHLQELNDKFGAELHRTDSDLATYDELRAHRQTMHRMVLQLIATILGTFPGDTPTEVSTRQALLGPIVKQQTALANSYRNRRGGRDIDPDTGLETADELDADLDPGPDLLPPTVL